MNEDLREPKSGFYIDGDNFSNSKDWSFTVSLNRKSIAYAMDGYDQEVTHKGHQTEVFVMLFKRTFAIGYLSIERL